MMDFKHDKDFNKFPPNHRRDKEGDLILRLPLIDVRGRKLRVKDCEDFKVFVWTVNPNHFISFNKRDIK